MYIKIFVYLCSTITIKKKKMEFTYKTKSENKKVVLGKLYQWCTRKDDNRYFVDVYPEHTISTSNYYKTEEEAMKRFNSIRNRVSDRII